MLNKVLSEDPFIYDDELIFELHIYLNEFNLKSLEYIFTEILDMACFVSCLRHSFITVLVYELE